ncbi:MAG: ABC transporter ATP-binding protein [Cellulosilyticaceae bacterium]
MFEIQNLQYKHILNIPHLVIPQGKITCIIGPSGGGKSTLLRHLNKLLSPSSGRIYFKGQDLTQISSVSLRRQVVMLGQTPTIFPGNIRDNLLIGLQFAEKSPVPDAQLVEILDAVHLTKSLDDACTNLSGGEKQRLALARVLLLNPEVLLLDEPSSALDSETELKVVQDITSYIHRKGKTLIMVTHSKQLASHYGENIIHLEKGAVTHGQ